MSKTGNLSINSENIFPIIKKWLYQAIYPHTSSAISFTSASLSH